MIHPTDLPTLHAAASALRHAPASMRAAHLAERLEEMVGRVVCARCMEPMGRGHECER